MRITCILLIFVFVVQFAGAYENPAARNVTMPQSGAGVSPTVPPSTYGRQTVPSRISESDFALRNRLFGYYEGVSPYRSGSLFNRPRYEMGDPLDNSLPISPFLRRSTSNIYGYRNTSQTRPYTLPIQPRTSMGRRGVDMVGSQNLPTALSPEDLSDYTPLRSQFDSTGSVSDRYLDTNYRPDRPLSLNTQELQDFVDRQIDVHLRRQKLTPEEIEADKQAEDMEDMLQDDLVNRPMEPDEPVGESEPRIRPQDETAPEDELLQIEPEQEEDLADELLEELEQEEAAERRARTGAPEIPEPIEIPEADHKKAQELLGDFKNYEEYVQAKYKNYVDAARQFMESGKFYKAADAYTIADIYIRDQVETFLGRAHALFGAGEFMSSSYYLAQAVELNADTALQRREIILVIGSRDLFDDRMVELAGWLEKTKTPELAFLYAYLLYNTDRFEDAARTIDLAVEKMDQQPAVKALEDAIEKIKKEYAW